MNNMTDEEAKEFNLACAEYMGWELTDYSGNYYIDNKTPLDIINNDTQLNDMIEKMKIDIEYSHSTVVTPAWVCCQVDTETFSRIHMVYDKDRRTAIIKCIKQVLRGEV